MRNNNNINFAPLLKKFKITAIIVTHDIMDAMEISDRIIVIDKGEVMKDGLPNEPHYNQQWKNRVTFWRH